MKSVLMSIRPKWCELIANGKKTVEVRKTRPKLETPFKVHIYCTKEKVMGEILLSNGKVEGRNRGFRESGDIPLAGNVIGEFVCEKIDRIAHCGTCNNDIRLRLVDKNFNYKELDYEYFQKCKLLYPDIEEYSNGRDVYGWHISDLVIYDKPKELREFFTYCGENPKCDGCEAHYYSNTECGKEDYCCSVIDGCKPIKRPPQSWCYVEGVNDNG